MTGIMVGGNYYVDNNDAYGSETSNKGGKNDDIDGGDTNDDNIDNIGNDNIDNAGDYDDDDNSDKLVVGNKDDDGLGDINALDGEK